MLWMMYPYKVRSCLGLLLWCCSSDFEEEIVHVYLEPGRGGIGRDW